MPVKTIIVNGDDKWVFRSILMSHGLDLYRVDGGVFFRDCTPISEAAGGAATLLANFPEDFSQDPFALEAEVREDLRLVFRQDDHALSMALILNREDVSHFSRAGKNWEVDPRLSNPAKTALRSMFAAMRLIEGQVDQENRVSRATTRVWFSLIIRDAGGSNQDLDLAENALNLLSGQRGHVHNAFLLSNGLDQDSRMSEQVEHFVKLRALIDMLSTEPGSTVRTQVRRSQRSGVADGLPVAHVRLPQDGPQSTAYSAVLRKALIDEVSSLDSYRGQTSTAGGAEDFKRSRSEIKNLLPSRWSETETYEVTLRGLDADVRTAREETIRQDELQSSELAKADAAEIINGLTKKSFKNKLMVFRRKPDYYDKLRAEYESAFNISRDTYATVVDARITAGRAAATEDRPNLVQVLDQMVLPSAADGEDEVAVFRQEIADAKTQTGQTIAEVRDKSWALEKDDDGGAHERSKAFKVAQLAENNLMGPGALWLMLWIFLVSLLPVIVFYGADAVRGTSSISSLKDVIKALGLLGYVVAISTICAAFVGGLTAVRLMRKRRIAIEKLAARLQANFDTLRGLAASRLALSLNRVRQADLELVWQSISSQEAPMRRDATRDFGEALIQTSSEYPDPNIDDAKAQSLTSVAVQAFKSGKSDIEKIRNFLAKRETPDPVDLKVTVRGISDQTTVIQTIAHLTPTEIVMAEPGLD